MRKCDKCWGSGWAIDHPRLGDRVRQLRQRSGWSERQLAQRLGISVSLLSLLERGKRSWSESAYSHALRVLWLRQEKN